VNTDGARVAQWGWLDNDCQRFRVMATDNGWSRIENMLAGRVLDAAFCGGPGTAVQLFTWLDNACQQFRLDPVGEVLISDAGNRRLLGASGCGRGRSAAVIGGRRTGDCQLWRFVQVDEGYFAIVHEPTGRPLTTGRPAGDADTPVVLGRTGVGGPGAQWRIEALDTGAYRLVNRDGRAMRLDRGRVYAGTVPGPDQEVLLLTP
jgi:hypothetical protein